MIYYSILMHLVINFQFSEEAKDIFKDFAVISHELRLNPLPYCLLPHELVEIFDNERILPGISYLHKSGEDFPYLNSYNIRFYLKSKDKTDKNTEEDILDRIQRHQRVLMFGLTGDHIFSMQGGAHNVGLGLSNLNKDKNSRNKTLVDLIEKYKQQET